VQYRHVTGFGHAVTAGATAFRGNDASGTLLAWRGWSIGDRVSVYGEVLPLPPLFSLRDPEMFEDQRSDGTRPFEPDLDHRLGYTARVRYQRPERGSIQLARINNRGDRHEYREEYSWQTDFYVAGGDIRNDRGTSLLAEYCWGSTGMGFRPEAVVDLDYYAGYVLASQTFGRNRLSARFDLFQTADRDRTNAETNSEIGRAWTFAWFYDVRPDTRLGVEFANIASRRQAAAESGYDPNTDGRTLALELRYRF
jgi:hypothetical protein